MARVTLGDVILRHVQLSAREAVTLILAVAKEWDRQCPPNASATLPATDAIQLHETGVVSFLVTPRTSSAQSDTTSESLSSLLGRLLGTDEADALHPRAALAVTQPAGAPAVPAVPDESFRSVLSRFADDDFAGTVASIFARTVQAVEEHPLGVTPARVHAGPERRRQPRIVAELRLDIRELERELFALRATSTPFPPLREPAGRRTIVRVAIAAAAACVVALLTLVAIERNPMRAGRDAVNELSAGRATDNATPAAPSVAPRDASVVEGTELRAVRPDRPSIGAPPRRARHRQVTPATTRAPKRPAATFAGGARSIDWLQR
jgi:hypothetical protein